MLETFKYFSRVSVFSSVFLVSGFAWSNNSNENDQSSIESDEYHYYLNQAPNYDRWVKLYKKKNKKKLKNHIKVNGLKPTINWLKDNDLDDYFYALVEPKVSMLTNMRDLIAQTQNLELNHSYNTFIFATSVARADDGIGAIDYGHRSRYRNNKQDSTSPLADEILTEFRVILAINNISLDDAFDNRLFITTELNKKFSKKQQKKYQAPMAFSSLITKLKYNEGLLSKNMPVSLSDYISHINTIKLENSEPFKEIGLAKKWPSIFPFADHESAPPLLLMPHIITRSQYDLDNIWKNFNNTELDEKKRFRTYGIYLGNPEKKANAAEVNAASVHPLQSIMRATEVGGVCGTMSAIARGTYNGLAIPSVGCSQPGHANTCRYSLSDSGEYSLAVGQSVASLFNTSGDWFLSQSDSASGESTRAGRKGEYLAGLALAMNKTDKPTLTYLVSQALVVRASERKNNKKMRLLALGLESTPYNPDLWYTYLEASGHSENQAKFLISLLRNKINIESDFVGLTEEVINKDAYGYLSAQAIYRDTVIARILQKTILANELQLSEDFTDFISNENDKNYYNLAPLTSAKNVKDLSKVKLKKDKSRLKKLKKYFKNT